MKKEAMERLQALTLRYPALLQCKSEIGEAFERISLAYRRGGRLYLCGNGGSAADCEHIVGELMKSFRLPRALSAAERENFSGFGKEGEEAAKWLEKGLPALSLTSPVALNTAFSNDRNADFIFAQQVFVLGTGRDVLWAITTSGNSRNCVYAAVAAKAKGMCVVALTGRESGKIGQYGDVCIRVPETETFAVQEQHLPVYHCLCAMLEEEFFSVADAAVPCGEDGKRQGSPKKTDEPERKGQ